MNKAQEFEPIAREAANEYTEQHGEQPVCVVLDDDGTVVSITPIEPEADA